MNNDRVTAAQNEIRQYLPDRESYVINTSEFEQVKARLLGIDMKQHLSSGDSHRPVLLKRTESGGTQANAGNNSPSSPETQDPDRPTLKRAPGSDQN
jgi:hypothetical protein